MKKTIITIALVLSIFALTACGLTDVSVTFDVGDGTQFMQNISSGNTIEQPNDPEVVGFEFLGWFTDIEMTEEFDFTTEINEDITIYGGWEYLFTPLSGITQTVMDEIAAGDQLWYRINVPEAMRLNIYTTGNTDMYGYILNENEDIIEEDDGSFDFGNNFQFVLDFEPGIYYIVAEGYDEDIAGTFNLEIRELSDVVSIYTDSDTLEAGDALVYTLDVVEAGTFHIYTTGDVDTYGYLLAGEDILLEDDDRGPGSNFFIIADLGIGSYDIAVEGYEDTDAGALQFIIEQESE